MRFDFFRNAPRRYWSVPLDSDEGMAALAAPFDGGDALLLANSGATSMSRPMVREEAVRLAQHSCSGRRFAVLRRELLFLAEEASACPRPRSRFAALCPCCFT